MVPAPFLHFQPLDFPQRSDSPCMGASLFCPLLPIRLAQLFMKPAFVPVFARFQIAVFTRQFLVGHPIKPLGVFMIGDLPFRQRAQR